MGGGMPQVPGSAIVSDGASRARVAAVEVVRAEVEAEFEPRLQEATLWQRWALKREMQREVERRLKEMAPPSALY